MNKKISKALEGMINICARKMNINELNYEIKNYMMKSPSLMVVTIERKEDGYYSTIYMTKEDLRKS